MSGDLQSMRQRAAAAESLRPKGRALPDRFQRRVEEAARRRAAEQEAALQAALEQQRINAQKQRDQRLQSYEQANAAQRAGYAADAAALDYGYTSRLNDQRDKSQRKRDALQERYAAAQERRQGIQQADRDFRQFGFSQQENATEFQNQLQRDALQQGYTIDRDKLQNRATMERDARQFGYSVLENDQQQRAQLQRDSLLNRFATAEDMRQQQFTLQRDELQNQFETAADARQQEYVQQNMYQREAADIAARWQEQVAQARNSGMDFSARQRAEMQQLDAAFRKNVLNGPYDEGLKKQALVEHQKKLAAIIPEEKVANPDEEIQQTFRYNEQMGTWLKRGRDSQGFPDWEPIGDGGQQDKLMQAQQKQVEQRQIQMQKAKGERLDKFQEIVKDVRLEADIDGNAIYKDNEAVMREAAKRFQPYEDMYQQDYGLPPLFGTIQADPMNRAVSPQAGAQTQPSGGMADSLAARGGYEMPVISHTKPIPEDIAKRFKNVPGGDQLIQIREKNSSNSIADQTIRASADIVINAIMNNDKTDPDLPEAVETLRRAGWTLGK